MATVPTVAGLQALNTQLQAQVLAVETAATTTAMVTPAATTTTAAPSVVVFADTP